MRGIGFGFGFGFPIFNSGIQAGASAEAMGVLFDIDFTALANLDDFTEVNAGGSSYTLTGNGLEITGTPSTSFGGNCMMYDQYLSGLQNWVLEIDFIVKSHSAGNEGVIVSFKGDSTIASPRNDSFVWYRNTASGGDGDGYRYFNDSSVLTPNTFISNPLVDAVAPVVDDTFRITITRSMDSVGALFTMKIENLTTPSENSGSLGYTYVNTSGQLDMNTSKFGVGTIGGTHWITNMKLSTTDQKNVDYITITDSMSAYCGSAQSNNWFELVKAANGSKTFTKTGCQSDKPSTALNKSAELQLINGTKAIIMIGSNQVISDGDALTRVDFEAMTDILEAAGITRANMIIVNVPPRLGNADIPTFNTWLSTEYSASSIVDVNTEFNNGSDSMSVTYDCGDGIHPNDAGHTWIADEINLLI